MPTPLRLQLQTSDPGNVLAPFIKSYEEHLKAARFKSGYRRYVASVIHFGHWLSAENCAPGPIDEAIVSRFLSEHLPQCSCHRPVSLELIGNRAALNHLIRVLRCQDVVAPPPNDEIAR